MVQLTDIHSLTGFLRNHKRHLSRLAKTGRPEVLTVNGEAKVVIQDAAAYQRLLEAIDQIDTERVIRERLKSAASGTATLTAASVLAEARQVLAKATKSS